MLDRGRDIPWHQSRGVMALREIEEVLIRSLYMGWMIADHTAMRPRYV